MEVIRILIPYIILSFTETSPAIADRMEGFGGINYIK